MLVVLCFVLLCTPLASSERRLSNNAYIDLSSEDDVEHPKYISNYLTAKYNNRARSCSPSLPLDKINIQDTVTITTTAIGTASARVCVIIA